MTKTEKKYLTHTHNTSTLKLQTVLIQLPPNGPGMRCCSCIPRPLAFNVLGHAQGHLQRKHLRHIVGHVKSAGTIWTELNKLLWSKQTWRNLFCSQVIESISSSSNWYFHYHKIGSTNQILENRQMTQKQLHCAMKCLVMPIPPQCSITLSRLCRHSAQ